MTESTEYSKYSPAQVAGYVFLTAIYIIFIGIMMIKVSGLWFLALLLWNWTWTKKTDTD